MGDRKQQAKGSGATAIVSKNFKRPRIREVWLFSLIGFVIVVAIVVGVAEYFHHRSANNAGIACSSQAAGSILQQASKVLLPGSTVQLGGIVTKIKSLPNYQKDPNCLYVVTTYYVNTFNLTAAESSLSQFNTAYKSKPLNANLGRYASVTGLRNSVAALKLDQQQTQKNSAALSPKPLKQ